MALYIRNVRRGKIRVVDYEPGGIIRIAADDDVELTTLPQSITEWYQFCCRDYWVEDAGYEDRNRYSSGLYLPWHELGVWAIPVQRRRREFIQVTEDIRSLLPTTLSHTPNSPMTAFAKGAIENSTPKQREVL